MSPPIIFARIVRPMNALQLCHRVFTQRNFVADFPQSAFLHRKRPFCVFEPPFGELRGTVWWSSSAHSKKKGIVDFLLVLNELFSLGVTAEALRASVRNRRFRSNGVRL